MIHLIGVKGDTAPRNHSTRCAEHIRSAARAIAASPHPLWDSARAEPGGSRLHLEAAAPNLLRPVGHKDDTRAVSVAEGRPGVIRPVHVVRDRSPPSRPRHLAKP